MPGYNNAGHNIGTAEVESAFVSNASVAEAAVVGFFQQKGSADRGRDCEAG